MAAGNHAGFAGKWIDWTGSSIRYQNRDSPAFSTSKNYFDCSTITQELILYNLRNSEKYRMCPPHTNGNANCSNNPPHDVRNNCTVADEKSEVLAWLSSLEPQKRHQKIRAGRFDGVGDWLSRTAEYQNWSDSTRGGESNHSALFCYGGHGVGKTYIR